MDLLQISLRGKTSDSIYVNFKDVQNDHITFRGKYYGGKSTKSKDKWALAGVPVVRASDFAQ